MGARPRGLVLAAALGSWYRVAVSHEDARKGHIGIATQEGDRVHVRVRAEGRGVVGDYSETLTVRAFRAAGWKTDEPLRDGATVRILPS